MMTNRRVRLSRFAGSSFLLLLIAVPSCASLDTVRAKNRENLNRLAAGMSKGEVLSVMGTKTVQTYDPFLGLPDETITNPYRTELYRAGGSVWELLLYYTDLKAADGGITDDELTPLVLKDGKLDGWGWSYWDDVVTRYEIRIR